MQNQPKKTTDREYYMFAVRIMGNFGATIAVPVVLFVLIGQYLDKKFYLHPWLTIVGFVVAALLSGMSIYTKSRKYGQEYQAMNRK